MNSEIYINILLFLIPMLLPLALCKGFILYKQRSNPFNRRRQGDTGVYEDNTPLNNNKNVLFIYEAPLTLISFYVWSITVLATTLKLNITDSNGPVAVILSFIFSFAGHVLFVLSLWNEEYSTNKTHIKFWCTIVFMIFMRFIIWKYLKQ